MSIDSGPSGPTSNPEPVFGFSSPDPGASFECSVDSGQESFGPCGGSHGHRAGPLADGPYVFRVRVTDSAGGQSVATRAFEVDTFPPRTRIRRAPRKRSLNRTPTYKFYAVDLASVEPGDRPPVEHDARFVCSLDGRPQRPCASPKTYRVRPGRHVFTVVARDAAGNWDPAPVRDSFFVRRPG